MKILAGIVIFIIILWAVLYGCAYLFLYAINCVDQVLIRKECQKKNGKKDL